MSLNWFHVPDEYFATFSSMALSKSKTVTSSNMISSIGLVKLAKKSDSFFHPTVAQVKNTSMVELEGTVKFFVMTAIFLSSVGTKIVWNEKEEAGDEEMLPLCRSSTKWSHMC